mmetsp:Transcript_34202/g.103233  ORF Transcript_34202/g.103233 Transcript_34202/m.103233 type:complete len:698 (+) Transcript_34202:166-2259(+)
MRRRRAPIGALACLATAAVALRPGAPTKRRTAVPRAAAATEPATFDLETEVPPERVRNFAIIAHIDHGKSTLADRMLEMTNTVASRDMQAQLLDSMDLERERGITIKLNAARMNYVDKNGDAYVLNLIDTPGHVDFSYEVSRSLAACEGALLVVDAAQGVQAQTLANVYLALENDLEIIPVLNKVDLPAAEPERVAEEIEATIGLDCTDAVLASAKSGLGVDDVLEAVVQRMPPPDVAALDAAATRCLIFDSKFDAYQGVVTYFRVVDGPGIARGDRVKFLATGKMHDVTEVGIMAPDRTPIMNRPLRPGEVGYFVASIKSVDDARVGDTVTVVKSKFQPDAAKHSEHVKSLPGYAEATPMVFAGVFPVDADQYESLRDALGKLKLNDAALRFEAENSPAMGFGFRCGFLGLLHMEIVQERLEREYDVDLIITAPSVVYKVVPRQAKSDQIVDAVTAGEVLDEGAIEAVDDDFNPTVLVVDNPSRMPDKDRQQHTLEPYVRLEVIAPTEYTGALMDLANERRGELVDMKYLTPTRTTVIYQMPLAEVITDFFDQVKSRTRGYASMEYAISGYRESPLVRLDVKINGELAAPLSTVVHEADAQSSGKVLVRKLKEFIPRQMFKVPIQACVGANIVASVQLSAMRKDVLAKCYGGDISRKKKLLQKQAKGKKRMKAMGKVNVPQEAFMAVLNLRDSGGD